MFVKILVECRETVGILKMETHANETYKIHEQKRKEKMHKGIVIAMKNAFQDYSLTDVNVEEIYY